MQHGLGYGAVKRLVLLCLVSYSSSLAMADHIVKELFSVASPSENGFFGFSFQEIDENLLVGANGSVHVIDINGGSELLRINNGASGFGDDVTHVGDFIAVSESIGRGKSVYLYDATSGELVRTIDDPTPPGFGDDRFGHGTEAVDGRLYISDASCCRDGQGTVHVFDPESGNKIATIANPSDGYGFGSAIEEHYGDVFIGARGSGPEGTGIVFRYDDGATTPSLTFNIPILPDGSDSEVQFGSSLDSYGDRLLVGAPLVDKGDQRQVGEAYLFDANTGDLLMTIENPEPIPRLGSSLLFGRSVALNEDYLVVGTPGLDTGGQGHVGGFYVFEASTGDLIDKVLNPIPRPNSQYTDGEGKGGVMILGDKIVASEYIHDYGRIDVFSVPEPSTMAIIVLGATLLTTRRRKPYY
jgi:WD40 repeat protein